jgi:hypothetical protein
MSPKSNTNVEENPEVGPLNWVYKDPINFKRNANEVRVYMDKNKEKSKNPHGTSKNQSFQDIVFKEHTEVQK